MCQLQCLMSLLLETVGCTRHLFKGRHQISLQDKPMTQLCQKSASVLLVVTFVCNLMAQVLNLRFLNTSEKTVSRLNLIIKMTYASLNRAAERKLTESCLNSWPVCGGAGQLWVLPWQGEVEPSGSEKLPSSQSVTALSQLWNV